MNTQLLHSKETHIIDRSIN